MKHLLIERIKFKQLTKVRPTLSPQRGKQAVTRFHIVHQPTLVTECLPRAFLVTHDIRPEHGRVIECINSHITIDRYGLQNSQIDLRQSW